MVGQVRQIVNRMSLKQIDKIQMIVDARRVTLQEEYAASFLKGDRVAFISQGYEYTGTIMESKNASVKISVDDINHAGTIKTLNAIWWLRANELSRSKSPTPTKSLDTSE